MEYLSRTLKDMTESKQYKYHPRCAKLSLTHLCFADDLLIFSKGETESVKAIMKSFNQFSKASGLQANKGKNSIYFGGMGQQEQEQILQESGFTRGELPFKYLGVPLSTRKLTMIQWKPIIDKIVARITSRTARKLSYAGRSQLISSVLFGVQSYWAQVFILPVKKEDRMWKKWIHAYYIKGQQMEQMKLPKQASWMVRKILEAKQIIEDNNMQICKGKGIIKQIYLQLLDDQPRVLWKGLMFGNAARPKAKFTLWLQMQNRLLTVDRLKKWGIQGEDRCSLCEKEEETRDHIYVECTYTKEVIGK
ncbi:PREDICTED: uncharacterized protein LOC109220885 [Nicotiana attenuata]|uniref:uncharacterized protein LOC109220885 n=1 Tax=Nicotiana attenuata TaxID=49451 RepID=UPI00090477BB|nr:PREDICTED: uncharacterized protein LOC109220885 [Nicotiana attenuata]